MAKPSVDSPPKRPAKYRKTVETKPIASRKGIWHYIGFTLKRRLALGDGRLIRRTPHLVSPSRIAPTTGLYTDWMYIIASAINRDLAINPEASPIYARPVHEHGDDLPFAVRLLCN